ncbi:hypothetical protein BaRGS_00014016 [Batillaria attramentaria]|uniref:Uncharacterized protein n=1 Tax=Batillaria attramentaria TaxID=370345 RepID=A0ABD0L4Z6_9CAEN
MQSERGRLISIESGTQLIRYSRHVHASTTTLYRYRGLRTKLTSQYHYAGRGLSSIPTSPLAARAHGVTPSLNTPHLKALNHFSFYRQISLPTTKTSWTLTFQLHFMSQNQSAWGNEGRGAGGGKVVVP